MKKRQNISIFPLLIMCIFLVFVSSCEKDDASSGNSTNGKTTAVFNPDVTYGTMTDQDGNVYKTVTIGTQTWMAENLRTTKYNDGTSIPNVTGAHEWSALKAGAYCNYNNTSDTDTIASYGRLYNWYTINTGRLAPNGWHVPTSAEWNELTDYLGGTIVAGDKLKEIGTTHWSSHNIGATNETGFTALPGGSRINLGTFSHIGHSGYWWGSSKFYTDYAGYRKVYDSNVYSYLNTKELGFSVRCVRD